jgi:hypothetical protein
MSSHQVILWPLTRGVFPPRSWSIMFSWFFRIAPRYPQAGTSASCHRELGGSRISARNTRFCAQGLVGVVCRPNWFALTSRRAFWLRSRPMTRRPAVLCWPCPRCIGVTRLRARRDAGSLIVSSTIQQSLSYPARPPRGMYARRHGRDDDGPPRASLIDNSDCVQGPMHFLLSGLVRTPRHRRFSSFESHF